ncbi:MAG: UDP-N-acetylmuramoyl-L-alanyl-D-glutamate--2,6-diaminopimelate ligase, partial [Gemmatimonadetes bacterium]|nr:UDP-N-acetylmuramoyl-L-alanyl-D-glutamate--2,6-diaminopimelate ligase [Gemmatimonadota bacterium]
GRFNVYNALCAAACALALDQPLEAVAAGLADASPVPGRLERIVSEPFDVFVDFAHTPDALHQVAGTLKALVAGRLIVVFGAGGDRDPTKRPEMGAAVSRHADIAVVTSDNPRTEDPATIVAEVAEGVAGCDSVEIVDRLEAIRWALKQARPGDAVLLAGKGHEAYQVVGTEKHPFDERRIVQGCLAGGRDG